MSFRKHPSAFLFAFLLLMMSAAVIISPVFRKTENIVNLLARTVPLAFIALGQTVALLIGSVDLSVGALASIVTALGAIIISPASGRAATVLWLVGSLTISLIFGLLNAFFIVKLRLSPLLATFCTGLIGQGIALAMIPRPTGYISSEAIVFLVYTKGPFQMPFVYFCVVLIFLYFFLHYVRVGHYFYAVGGNERNAKISGINVAQVKALGHVLASFFAGIGGIFLTCRIRCGDPTVGTPLTLDSVIAVLLGGTTFSGGQASIIGSVLGCLLLSFLSNIMNILGISSFYQYILKGLLFATAVVVYNRGK